MLNTRSMRNKLVNITELISEHNLDILCLTETWLFDSDMDIVKAALHDNYDIFHISRPDNGRGGGVAVIYKRGLSSVKLVFGERFASFEHIEVAIHHMSVVTRIAVIYRPGHPGTDQDFLNEFSLFLDNFLNTNGRSLICGDFNYWVDSPLGKAYSMEFVSLLDTNNIVNSVVGPTHVSGHTLDLVLSPTNTDFVREVAVYPSDLRLSDHFLVLFNLVHPKVPSCFKTIKFRNYRNVDRTAVARHVGAELGAVNTVGCSSSAMEGKYKTIMKHTEDSYCPVICKTILVKDGSPWFDASVAELRRERRRAERRWRRLRTMESRETYVTAVRMVVARISARKLEYYGDLVISCGNDQKKLYTVFNNLMGKNKMSPLPAHDSELQLATEFSDFFQTKIERIRRAFDAPLNGELSVEPVSHFRTEPAVLLHQFQPVNAEKVLHYIRSSRKTCSPLDPFDASRLPESLEAAADFIVKIINQGFVDETFSSLEEGLLRPYLKGKSLDCQNMSNYRPVSNLSLLSKIKERAVLDQLLPILVANEVIPSVQSAYKQFHSTETALCRIYNDLATNTCAGKSSVLVMLDLSAAFDTVDHQLLVNDMDEVGLRNSALKYMKSYLSDRVQRVVVGEASSDPVPLVCGVPQGSVLGPVLFSIYISGLKSVLQSHGVAYHFYADDTQFYIRVEDVAVAKEKVSMVIADIKKWMFERKLKLNEGKTEIMIVKGNSRHGNADQFDDFQVGDTLLHPINMVRDLGFRFDSSLNFRDQINYVVKVCHYHIRNLYMVRKFLNHQCLVTLVSSLVLSQIDYCNSLYIGLPKYLLRKLQSVLNKAARLVFLLPPRTSTTPSLIELHWLPMKARIEFKVCLLVFKALKYREPKYIVEMLTPFQNAGMPLRSGDDPWRLVEPRAIQGHSFADRCFSFVAPRLYNRVPLEIRNLTSVETFKKRLKTFIFDRAYDCEAGCLTAEYVT